MARQVARIGKAGKRCRVGDRCPVSEQASDPSDTQENQIGMRRYASQTAELAKEAHAAHAACGGSVKVVRAAATSSSPPLCQHA